MDHELNTATTREELFFYIQTARRSGLPLILLGPPGSGKTEMCKGLAGFGAQLLPAGLDPDTLPEDWEPKIISEYASQKTGEDWIGIPDKEGNSIIFRPPYKFASLQPGDIMLVDEITSPAAPSTSKVMLELFAGPTPACGDWVGPQYVTRIAMGNRAEDGNVDFVDNPVLNGRVIKVEYLGPHPQDEWLPDFATPRGVHPVIGTHIYMGGFDTLNGYDPEADRSPTPRSWWNASRALLAAEAIAGGAERVPIHMRQGIVSGCVGDAAALALESMFELRDKLVPYSEIVANPTRAEVPDKQMDPAALMLVVTNVGNRCTPDDWAQVTQYIKRLPIEMQGVATAPIIRRHPALTSTGPYQEYQVRTQELAVNA